MNIAVLGAGMVGKSITIDLAKEHSVTSFDVNENNLNALKDLNHEINIVLADLGNYSTYKSLLEPFELIITAVPGFMGFNTLKAVIECGKNVADISFFPENALELDTLALGKKYSLEYIHVK